MKIQSNEIELVSVNSLIPHPKNMHNHPDEQIERLCKIIEYQGFRTPVTVQRGTNLIVCGHGRLMAAKKLGYSEVPVTYQEFESEEQLYAHMVADNAIGKDTWATLDLSQINSEIENLGPDLNIDLLGIKDFVIEPAEKFEAQSDEDEVPEVKDPITKRGDVWILGEHRVMCGDSTMIDDVEKLMNGEKADMVFTDPPYGMKLDADYSKMPTSPSGAKPIKHRNIKGDHEDFSSDLINTIFACFDYCEDIFICGADYFCEVFPDKNDGSWIVWDKRVTENFDKMIGSAFELIWSKKKRKREIARINNTLYSGEADAKNKVHPTQKPLKLYDWIFERATAHKFVADLYLGSGSTLIACEKTNRKCYGMELDEHYCDVIINRWQNYTGKEAVLESNGKKYNDLKNESEGTHNG